jgi:hypothetical protein
MTWAELLQHLQQLTPAQLAAQVLILDAAEGQFHDGGWGTVTEDDDMEGVLFRGQPFLMF